MREKHALVLLPVVFVIGIVFNVSCYRALGTGSFEPLLGMFGAVVAYGIVRLIGVRHVCVKCGARAERR